MRKSSARQDVCDDASAEEWPPSEVKLLPYMSEAIFQQDGAPAHRAGKTQKWCRSHFDDFWAKDEWPGNSPDLSPIENLWSIVQEEMNKMAPATSEATLIRNVRTAWSRITPETLDNLMTGNTGPYAGRHQGAWGLHMQINWNPRTYCFYFMGFGKE